MRLFYSPKYHQGVTHLDSTGRKEYLLDSIAKPLWVSQELDKNTEVELVEPELLSKQDLLRIHSEEYIKALETSQSQELANSSGLRWVPELFSASLCSVSGLYRAVETAIKERVSGTLSTNFHHAKRGRGSGFCVLNGVAITVIKAIEEFNLKKILIIDCDFHYGDGTADLLKEVAEVHIYDIYGSFHRGNNTATKASNITNRKVKNLSEYRKALVELIRYAKKYQPELVIYDAGMDAYENDRLGGIKGVDEEFLFLRDETIFKFFKEINTPIAFVLGGGYVKYVDEKGVLLPKEVIELNRKRLASLHLNTIKIASQTTDSSV